MMTDFREIRGGEQQYVAGMLAGAFLDGPLASWLIRDRAQRYQVYVPYFRIIVDHVAEHGIIHVSDDLSAAALWLNYFHNTSVPPIADYENKLRTACGDSAARFMQLDETFAKIHPQEAHWYLMFIGVRHDVQRHGTGTALINYMLGKTGPAPVYLEASNMLNKALYGRLGFEELGEEILPDAGPPIWPMWRVSR
jgi:ribosomal protein S18 acetylase RimI-like enzyme